ncbi:hypothetical protein V6N13_137813 [Hibiscus sabdariffa]
MHGCNSGSTLLVNAEGDFMGGVVDDGVGIGVKTSPHRSAIGKAQAELRQEYDVREERRRELEFLEKVYSFSVEYSEAKGSFAPTASPHGDSVESIGRPGVPVVCEPNGADNLLLFDCENELPEGERKSMHPRKRNFVVPSEQSSQMDGTQNAKESEDSTIFRPYARSTAKSATSNGDLASKVITSDNHLNMEVDGGKTVEEMTVQSEGDLCESKVDNIVSKTLIDDLPKEPAQMEAHKSPIGLAFEELNLVGGKEQVVFDSLECPPGAGARKAENETNSHQLNGFGDAKSDIQNITNEGQNSSEAIGTKGLDSESSCTKNSLNLGVNNDNDVCIDPIFFYSNGKPLEQTSEKKELLNLAVGELAKEKNEIKAVNNDDAFCDTNTSMNQNHLLNDFTATVEEEIRSELQNEVSCPSNNEVIESSHAVSEADRRVSTVQGGNSNSNIEKNCASKPQGTMDYSICEITDRNLSGITYTANADTQTSSDNHVKVVDKEHEDSILEEAQIIEAKQKSIAKLSVGTLTSENSQKSHWDFVLEEMAWLANDFAQERLWKITAAAQICRRVAFTSRLKFEEKNQYWKLKRIALTLANAVMDFWHSAEVLLSSKNESIDPKTCGHDLVGSRANEVSEVTTTELDVSLDMMTLCMTRMKEKQAPAQTDASSRDTNSFQDDQSTLHGGLRTQNSLEVESIRDFERQLPYDCAGTPTKPKKKKKAKNLGSAYNQGWQLESPVHNEQRDYSKKRPENHQLDSNGNSGLHGQYNAKKLKIMKQQPDGAYDFIPPNGSISSPVGSQMSNMSNPRKIIRLIHGSDRGRKTKTPKVSTGQLAPGSPWSLSEDQALVVLVHDMGPNWQLVSDTINSTLQFKCISRKPKECKERHKILMDRSGDGADSADDSGSSQPYPSTLPGIPKGSARQLFQRLQGPMEEDTLKSHFEKIILIIKKHHYRQSQHDNQDPKQIVPVHNSHVIALSQVCPNNLNGGVLMPLDLCDAPASSQDVLPFGSQASHVSGLAVLNQGDVGSMLPASGGNSSLQGSSGMVVGSNLLSPSASLNAAARDGPDGRYGVPRTSLPADEQHRIQQYNQMLSGRNIQQSNLSLAGAVSGSDCGVCMLPAANGMGMMSAINRSMSMSRLGFQGMASSAMLNSGSMLSSNMSGMPSPVNMHSGPGSGQANSMLRPHDATHMVQPGHNPQHQRQLMVPEHQTQQMPPEPPHVLSKPHHATGSQQQVCAMRLAKERQMQPQQQFAASSTLIPHVQRQTQLPISSLQNTSQIQSQALNQSVSLPPTSSSPMTPISLQNQQKHQLSPQGLGRNPQLCASGWNNQIGKQRQQQQFQQSSRYRPQRRQQMQSQQHAKPLKGVGRGLMHQSLSADLVHLNGVGMTAGNQGTEKGEHMMQLRQGHGLYSGPGVSPVQPSKSLVSSQPLNHSQPQQKLMSGAATPSTKQLQQVAPHSDNGSQGQVSPVPSGHTLSAVHQSVPPAATGSHQPHLQLQSQLNQKQANQNQPSVQKMLQQKRQVNSDSSSKSQADQ